MSAPGPQAANQPDELADYNLFSTHSALMEALAREGEPADRAAPGAPGAFGTLPAGCDFEALTARVYGP